MTKKTTPAPKPKSTRGGARPGSGPKVTEPKIRRSVGLSARQWDVFDDIGGNDWLRKELDSKPPHNALESVQAAEMNDTRVPYAWEVTQGRRTFFVPAAEFTKSSYDTGTFKPLFE